MPMYYPSPANKGSKKFLFPDAAQQAMTPGVSPTKKREGFGKSGFATTGLTKQMSSGQTKPQLNVSILDESNEEFNP